MGLKGAHPDAISPSPGATSVMAEWLRAHLFPSWHPTAMGEGGENPLYQLIAD